MKQRLHYRSWHAQVLGVAVALGMSIGSVSPVSAQNGEPRFVLSGIVINAHGDARAILEEPQLTGGRSVLLKTGDMLGAYRVSSIGTDHAVLQGPSGTVRILLSGISAPAGPTVARAPETQKSPFAAAQQAPPATPDELEKFLTPPPPGVYRHASEGVSAPVNAAAAVDAADFKRQIQQHLMALPPR
jgi:hypothetical protein